MKNKMTECKTCGEMIAHSAKTCTNCGAKNKKPIVKCAWFWIVAVIVIVVAIASSGSGESEEGNIDSTTVNGNVNIEDQDKETQKYVEPTVEYEIVDLRTMMDDLSSNALRAETKYQNMHVEVTGKIVGFDSDGAYITIEPVYADEWNFDTVMCYIKSDEQRAFIIEKSKGDIVTIKGKITSIGEVLGYSIDIDFIS